jgi:hypothetical protein
MGSPFSMCKHVETTITIVYHYDSESTDIWVTQAVDGSHSEITGTLLGAEPSIVSELSAILREIVWGPHHR